MHAFINNFVQNVFNKLNLMIQDLLLGDPYPFVLAFTTGNLISLSGSFFLSGPKAQTKKMFHETRKHATIVYLASISLTVVVAFAPQFPGQALVLFLVCLLQTLSLTWYCLSYVPYARSYVKKTFVSLVNS